MTCTCSPRARDSYVDWANAYEPGEALVDGVVVHRFRVDHRATTTHSNARTEAMLGSRTSRSLEAQRDWLRMQGPYTPDLAAWLQAHTTDFDCIVFFTFLYWTTWQGLRIAGGVCPTVLHPTVHDEPALHFSIFDQLFRAPDVFAFRRRRKSTSSPAGSTSAPRDEIIGIGVESAPASRSRFRRAVAGRRRRAVHPLRRPGRRRQRRRRAVPRLRAVQAPAPRRPEVGLRRRADRIVSRAPRRRPHRLRPRRGARQCAGRGARARRSRRRSSRSR